MHNLVTKGDLLVVPRSEVVVSVYLKQMLNFLLSVSCVGRRACVMVSLSWKQTNYPVTMTMISRSRSQYKSTCFTNTKVLALLVARVKAIMSSGDATWGKRAQGSFASLLLNICLFNSKYLSLYY